MVIYFLSSQISLEDKNIFILAHITEVNITQIMTYSAKRQMLVYNILSNIVVLVTYYQINIGLPNFNSMAQILGTSGITLGPWPSFLVLSPP